MSVREPLKTINEYWAAVSFYSGGLHQYAVMTVPRIEVKICGPVAERSVSSFSDLKVISSIIGGVMGTFLPTHSM